MTAAVRPVFGNRPAASAATAVPRSLRNRNPCRIKCRLAFCLLTMRHGVCHLSYQTGQEQLSRAESTSGPLPQCCGAKFLYFSMR